MVGCEFDGEGATHGQQRPLAGHVRAAVGRGRVRQHTRHVHYRTALCNDATDTPESPADLSFAIIELKEKTVCEGYTEWFEDRKKAKAVYRNQKIINLINLNLNTVFL